MNRFEVIELGGDSQIALDAKVLFDKNSLYDEDYTDMNHTSYGLINQDSSLAGVATVTHNLNGNHQTCINSIAVRSELRGRRYGTALIRHVAKGALLKCDNSVLLYCFGDELIENFYPKLGFTSPNAAIAEEMFSTPLTILGKTRTAPPMFK